MEDQKNKKQFRFENTAESLVKNGYQIVPVLESSKCPAVKDWRNLRITDGMVPDAVRKYRTSNVGVVTGDVIAVDIDCYDKDVVMKIIDHCRETIGPSPVRVGNAPKSMLIYRADGVIPKQYSSVYEDFAGRRNAIEILGAGQFFVAYGKHPIKGVEYLWDPNEGLMGYPISSLPSITPDKIQALFSFFDAICPEDWEIKKNNHVTKTNTINRGDEEDCLAALLNTVGRTKHQWGEVLKNIDADNRENWVLCGMGLYHEFGGSNVGFKLWYEWSLTSTKSDEVPDFAAQWKSFRCEPGKTPITAKSILDLAKKTGYTDVVIPEPILEDMSTPSSETLESFLERFVYVKRDSLVYDTHRPAHLALCRLQEFHTLFSSVKSQVISSSGRISKAPVSKLWIDHPKRKHAEDKIFAPGEKIFVKDSDGYYFMNTFYFPNHPRPKKQCDLSRFYDHVEYLFPVGGEKDWFIGWLAFKIQHPEIKQKVTPLHVSPEHGTGRGWLVELIFKLLGHWNCSSTNIQTLCGKNSNYQDFMDDKLICVLEEIKDNVKYEASHKTRSLLTDVFQNINSKYGENKTKRNYTNFFMMSNHLDALLIDRRDRRFNIFTCSAKPKDNDYYTELYNWSSDANVGALFHELKNMPLPGFNWQRSVPSRSREDMIAASMGVAEQLLVDFLLSPPYPVMTFSEIESFVFSKMLGNLDGDDQISKGMLRVLLSKHAVVHKQIRVGDIRLRPWILDRKLIGDDYEIQAAVSKRIRDGNLK